jgi:hypothetical protein
MRTSRRVRRSARALKRPGTGTLREILKMPVSCDGVAQTAAAQTAVAIGAGGPRGSVEPYRSTGENNDAGRDKCDAWIPRATSALEAAKLFNSPDAISDGRRPYHRRVGMQYGRHRTGDTHSALHRR